MVAQSGVINLETEYNRTSVEDKQIRSFRFSHGIVVGDMIQVNLPKNTAADTELVNTVDDLDLGLVQRPEAQLKLTKCGNFRLVLANGTTMFDGTRTISK